ncbi:hypothetical protein ABZ752_22730 [Streptomyces roseifaciens]
MADRAVTSLVTAALMASLGSVAAVYDGPVPDGHDRPCPVSPAT